MWKEYIWYRYRIDRINMVQARRIDMDRKDIDRKEYLRKFDTLFQSKYFLLCKTVTSTVKKNSWYA